MDDQKSPSDVTKKNIDRLGDDYDEVLEMVDKEVKKAEVVMDPWKTRIIKYNELYKMYQHKRHYDGLATIFVPEILRAVETVVGNLYKAIFKGNPWFEYQGRTKDEDASAAANTQLVMYQMDENGFKHRTMDSLRQMAISGLTCRKILWDFHQVQRTRNNWVEESKGINGPDGKPTSFRKWQKEKFLDTVKDHWTFEPVDLLSLLIPDVTIPYNEMEKSRWIIEQTVVDKQYLREKEKKGWIIKADEKEYQLDDQQPSASRMRILKDNRSRTSGFTVKTSRPGDIEWLERWGLVKAKWVYSPEELAENGLEADDEIEGVIVILNRQAIVKLEANPFWHNQKPFLFCPYVPIEYQFDGIGIGQIGEKLQEELNDTRNQTMDNKTLILMCMWLKSRASGIKNADLRVRPMGVIATNDMNGLEALRPPVLTGVGVNIEGTVKNDLREATGAASNLQGIAQSGVSTATESSMVNQASLGRLELVAELYGELVMKKLLMMVQYMNQQFFDHDKIIRVIGPLGVKYRKLSRKELIGNIDVVLNLATDLGSDPATKRQQWMQFLTLLQQMQPQMIQFHWKLLDKIYKESFGGRGLDEIYEAPQEDVELLELEDEVDLILSGYPLLPQKRDDAKKRSHDLEAEYNKVKFALAPEITTVFQSVIMGYEQMAMAQLQAQQAALQQQMMAQQGGGGSGGNGMVPGQMSGTTPFTMPGEPGPTNAAQTGGV